MMTNPNFRVEIPLDSIRIANPCRADWNKMAGDDRSRFCVSCAKNVYNLSEMTRAEAENLVREREGELCVRFFQRADGTMITTDCPIGIKPNRKRGRISVAMLTIFAAPFLMVSAALAGTHFNKSQAMESLRDKPLIGALIEKLNPRAVPTFAMTGAVAFSPSTTTPTPQPTMGKPQIPNPVSDEATMGAPLPPQKCAPK